MSLAHHVRKCHAPEPGLIHPMDSHGINGVPLGCDGEILPHLIEQGRCKHLSKKGNLVIYEFKWE